VTAYNSLLLGWVFYDTRRASTLPVPRFPVCLNWFCAPCDSDLRESLFISMCYSYILISFCFSVSLGILVLSLGTWVVLVFVPSAEYICTMVHHNLARTLFPPTSGYYHELQSHRPYIAATSVYIRSIMLLNK